MGEGAANTSRADVLASLRAEAVSLKPLIDDVRLRRKLAKLGVKSAADLLEMSDDAIDSFVRSRSLEFSDADVLDGVRRRFDGDPVGFYARLSSSRESAAGESSGRAPALRPADEVISSVRPHTRAAAPSSRAWSDRFGGYLEELPDGEYARRLRQFEDQARSSLDRLAAKEDSYLVYEAFEDFPVELEDYREDFISLFSQYGRDPRTALRIIRRDLSNAFLVFVADLAREKYDGDALWNNLFPIVGIEDGNVQGEFKKHFMSILQERRMPTYGSDESDFYYQNTALLHGGLSEELWADLWRDSILPTVKRFMKRPWDYQGYLDGHVLLKAILEGEEGCSSTPTLKRILAKTPDAMIAPLLGSAIATAQQVADHVTRGTTMLSGYGLPDTALRALESVKGVRRDDRPVGVQRGESRNGTARDGSSYLYLPMGSLMLDLGRGCLQLTWKKQRIPSRYTGCKVEYLLDGRLLHTEPVKTAVNCCVLDAVAAEVGVQGHYDVVMRLLEPTDDGRFIEVSSLTQSIERCRPGCLEFMETSSGRFELRRPRDRVTRARRMAVLLLPGYELEPWIGMSAREHRPVVIGGKDLVIRLFDVDPGATGTIRRADGEVVAAWQETYTPSIERRYRLGTSAGGLDLYGVAPRLGGGNMTLPAVILEGASDGDSPCDIEVLLVCDGETYNVPVRRHANLDEPGELDQSVVITMPLYEIAGLDRHLESCCLTVKSGASGAVLFIYRFGVVPIKELVLANMYLQGQDHAASYSLRMSNDTVIERDGERADVRKGCLYHLDAPIEQAICELRISSPSEEKATDAILSLLGVDVSLPEAFMRRARGAEIDLADMIDLGPWSGGVSLDVSGRLPGRGFLMAFENKSDGGWIIPIAYLDLERPGARSANILSYPEGLVQDAPSSNAFRLVAAFSFGYTYRNWAPSQASCEALIANCREGLGTGSISFEACENGIEVRFQSAVRHTLVAEVHAESRLDSSSRVIESHEIAPGAQGLSLSSKVLRKALSARDKPPRLYVLPLTPFGDPMPDYATVLEIRINNVVGDD